jgi:hypothetical protein
VSVDVGPGQAGGEQGPEVRRRDPLEDLRDAGPWRRGPAGRSTTFTGIRHDPVQAANVAVRPQKTPSQDSAIKKGAQLPFHKPWHQPPALLLPGQESLKMFDDDPIEDALLHMAWGINSARLANQATLSKTIALLALHLFITTKSWISVEYRDGQTFHS